MSSCRIHLDNFSAPYYTGSEVIGRVVCNFSSEKNVRAIKVRLKCKEHTEWTDTESYYDSQAKANRTRYVTYTGDSEPFYKEIVVFHGGIMPPGNYVYPFNFFLPKNLPSTYGGSYGTISYKVKAVVDRPMKTDFEDQAFFPVVSLINFNEHFTELQHRVSYSDEKTVCCWCCAGGNISMDVELQKEAFIPGESIPLKVKVINLSNVSMESLGIILEQTITSRVRSPSSNEKSESDRLLSHYETGVGAHGERVYDLAVEIPRHIVVPNFTASSLFSIRYKLTITGVLPSCHMDLDVDSYPKLGHIQMQVNSNIRNDVSSISTSPPPFPSSNGAPYPIDTSAPPYPAQEHDFVPPPYPGSDPSAIGFPDLPPTAYPPSRMPMPSAPTFGLSEKPLYEGGTPSAPSPYNAASSSYEMPPPGYETLNQEKPPYPPQ